MRSSKYETKERFDMPMYKIIHREELIDEFFFEAENERDAMNRYNHAVENGEIDFSRMEMVDSSDTVELDTQ